MPPRAPRPLAPSTRPAGSPTDGPADRRPRRAVIAKRARRYAVTGAVAAGCGFLAALRLADEHPMAAIVGASAVACGVVGVVVAGRLGARADSLLSPAEQPPAAVRLIALWGVVAGAMSLYYSL